jgi:sucrose-6-phosphate hydrolase SacC (GH32 family)
MHKIYIVRKLLMSVISCLTMFSLLAQRELYRPIFHYSPQNNWMNDPNGLVYYNGKYHMFYQYNPSGTQPNNMSWGHAISSDLINWDEKPVAIPAQNGVMIYSGSVVVDWNNTSGFGVNGKPPLVAIYTGKTTVEDQRIAYSNDEGLTWTNYSQNPVLNMNNNQFRDPKVIWHNESKKWIMVVSTGGFQGIPFYSSTDLKVWTPMSGFASMINRNGAWECPDFFKLPVDNDTNKSKWVLVHSVAPTAQYFIGNFDGTRFGWETADPTGLVINDFENSNYDNWIVTGNAFGTSPTLLPLAVLGNLGKGFANSTVLNAEEGQGKLVSPNFAISKNHISFLIEGGYRPTKAYIKLVVNGETVRTSTGMNEELFKWRNWDVSSFVGKTAHIEIVDSATGPWGHIKVDHILQSDGLNDHLNAGQVDYGKDFYALQSFSDMPDGRRIWLAWLNSWSYAVQIPTTPWRGIMSIPREVKLETHYGQLKLVQKPVDELKALRQNRLHFDNASINLINRALTPGMANTLFNPNFKQFELKAKIAVMNKPGFSLKFKKHGSQYAEFIFDFINQVILFDRSKSTGGNLSGNADFREIQAAPLLIENGYIDLHLFVDNCSAELFTANGQIVMSNQIFPDSNGNRVEITSLNDDFDFEEFDIWKLGDSIPLNNAVINKPLFHIYPNPVTSSSGLTIKKIDPTGGTITFKLYSAKGELISEFQSVNEFMILPRNKMPVSKGFYFLKGSDGISSQTEKVLFVGQ